MGLFSLDNAFGRFMDKVGKWTALNFLYLLSCLPILTAGSATAALYAVSLKLARREEVSVAPAYFTALKQNLKKGILIHLIMLLIGAVMALSLYYIGQLQAEFPFYAYFKWIVYVIALVYTMVLTYVYPLLAVFENTVRQTLMNAMLLSIMHLPATVLMLAISIGPLVLCYFVPAVLEYALFFYLLCGFAATAFLHCQFFVQIFAQYSQKDHEVSDDED